MTYGKIKQLYEALLVEQVKHYEATRNPEVAQRGVSTIREYIAYVRENRQTSDDPIALLSFAGFEDSKIGELEKTLLKKFDYKKD